MLMTCADLVILGVLEWVWNLYLSLSLSLTDAFLFDKLYIYTPKKKSLIFFIKIMFDGDLL